MFESLLLNYGKIKPQEEIELEPYTGQGLMEFLSNFSSPTISGAVTITPQDPDSVTGIEVVHFGGGKINVVGSGGGGTPFHILDGEGFILQAWVKPETTNYGLLYNDLINSSGASTILMILNNIHGGDYLTSLDVKHVNQTGADMLGQTRYRMGLNRRIPVNVWSLIKYVCDGKTIKGYINDELLGEYPWKGAIQISNRDFVIGSSIDNSYTYRGKLDGFRFLKFSVNN